MYRYVNSSNVTNETNRSIDIVLSLMDQTFRYVSLLLHVIYVLVLALSPSIRKRTFLYINHANLTSLVYVSHSFLYTFGNHPATNRIFCSISELMWGFLLFLRIYSIVLVAVYRYVATFRFALYKKLNDSLVYLTGPLAIVWLISIVCPLFGKYVFSTGSSSFWCLDGYSDELSHSLAYFVYKLTLAMIAPPVVICLIYYLILRELKAKGARLDDANQMSSTGSSDTGPRPSTVDVAIRMLRKSLYTTMNLKSLVEQQVKKSQLIRKEKRFASQFILMSVSVIISSCFLAVLALGNVMPRFFAIFGCWVYVFRIASSASVSLIPVISLYYHPEKHKTLLLLKRRIFPNQITVDIH